MPETDTIPVVDKPPLADYAAARSGFSWEAVAGQMGADASALNLGALATQRQVAAGRAQEHAIVYFGMQTAPRRVTYAELTEWSGRAANVLTAHGVGRGDRVLFLLPEVFELHAGVLGALRAGAVVGVLGSGRNIEYLRNIFTRTRPRAIVTVPSFRNTMASLRQHAPELRNVFFVPRGKLAISPLAEGEVNWADQCEAAPPGFGAVATAPGDPAILHYTDLGMSGCALPHRLALALFNTARTVLEMRAGESVISMAMPGEHLYATYSLLAPLLTGSTHLIFEDPAHFTRWGDVAAEFQPRAWLSAFKAVDVLLRVDPNLGTLLLGCRNIACTWPYDRYFVSMTAMSYGSPLHAVWTDREFGALQCAELRGCPIRPGSVGRPLPGTDVRVVDEGGVPLDAGVPGRLAVKIGTGAPFHSYWGEPELAARHVRDGWFVTSHAARVDADGYVWIES